MNRPLPDWIESVKLEQTQFPHRGRYKLLESVLIAWEALRKVELMGTPAPQPRECLIEIPPATLLEVTHALDQIRTIGEEVKK